MSSRTHHFRIGLFVIIGALLFVGALFAMGLRSYFGQFDLYETALSGKVDNLSPGALVKLRGVTIGKVTTIDFVKSEYPQYKEDAVLVHFEVPKNTVWSDEGDIQKMLDKEVANGLRARVQGQGFLGASIVSLEYVDPKMYPVEPIPWTPKHYYIPSAPSQFNRVLASLEKSLRHAEDVNFDDLVGRVQGLITAADQLIGKVEDVDFKQLSGHADVLITNADSLVLEFRETNRRLQTALNGVDLPGLGHDTAALEAKLSADADELQHVLASVDMGDLNGSLANLNGSLANVRNATDELIVLLHKIEQRPSSVIFSKPPQPVPQMEQPPKK